MRKTVLITGATSGIGKELTLQFAKNKFDICIVSRNQKSLLIIKEELEKRYNINVYPFVSDLSVTNAAIELYQKVQNKNLVIDQLVCCAGAGKTGTLLEHNVETIQSLLNLNVNSITELTLLFGKKMKKGKILIVSSTAGFGPDVGLNVYGPTKSYERSLCETLYGELKGKDISISCLCPGPTKTNWSKNAGRKDSSWAMNSKNVARIGYKGMQKGKLIIIPGVMNKGMVFASKRLSPKFIGAITASFQKNLKS